MKGASSWKEWAFGDREWQTEAWRLYDITGQLRFVANSVANSLSMCRLYVAELDEAGHEIGEATDPKVSALAAGPLGKGPAKSEQIRLLGLCLFVAGESWIVAESRKDGDVWYAVSGRQVQKRGGQIIITRPATHGGGKLTLSDDDLLQRVWTPHPADTDEPDSPARSALPDLRELEAIRKREFAELDSRLTGAGLMFLPHGIDYPQPPAQDGVEPRTGIEGFSDYVLDAMATSIQDRSSAAAMAPIMAELPADVIDKIRHMTFWSDLSDQLLPLKESALKGLAQSLDAPIELMEGLSNTNHWNAWLIDEHTIKTHYEPPLARIADALTEGYLVGALEAMGKDPAKYAYRFSTAPLRVRADRTADALVLHERGLLADTETVEAADFDPDQMPSADELLQRRVDRLLTTNPDAVLSDPTLRAIAGIPGEPLRVESERVTVEPIAEVEEPRGLPERPEEPPEAQGLVAACELIVLRALELAGGRLVPHRDRGDTPRHQLHTRIGAADKPTADKALAGAWDHVGLVASVYQLPEADLRGLLHGYVTELLTHRAEHHRGLLAQLIGAAVHRG